jgi:hypothetical protein
VSLALVFARVLPRLVSVIFLAAAIEKMFDPRPTEAAIRELGIRGLAASIVFVAIAVDIILGVCLAATAARSSRLISACCFVLLVYTGYIVTLWIVKPSSSCGCFGSATPVVGSAGGWMWPVARNVSLMAALIVARVLSARFHRDEAALEEDPDELTTAIA